MFVNPDHNLLESVWDETTWDIAAEMISHFSPRPTTLGEKICIRWCCIDLLSPPRCYLFGDTHSMCIVGSKTKQLVPCAGGQFNLNGKHAVQTLTLHEVKAIPCDDANGDELTDCDAESST